MNNIRAIERMQQREGLLGVAGSESASWHSDYQGSAYIYVGNIDYGLNEGDLIQIFSQYGVVTRVDLARTPPDKENPKGKSKGFAFLCYEDERSCILAVDNFNGIAVLGRTLKVDHVKRYKRRGLGEEASQEERDLIDGVVPLLETEKEIAMKESAEKHERIVALMESKHKREREELGAAESFALLDQEIEKIDKKRRKVEKQLQKLGKQARQKLISEKQRQFSAEPLEKKLV